MAHSRFVAPHRADRDRLLLRLFGPNGTADRLARRYVVVASQVAEQSLDVDFDVMITDIAPVDLVLQRLGRVHRHAGRVRATGVASARCYVTGVPDWCTTPPTPARVIGYVYSRFLIYRSLAVLDPYLDGRMLVLPADISTLVQSAYGEREVAPASWAAATGHAQLEHQNEMDRRVSKAKTFRLGSPSDSTGLIGWLTAGVGEVDDTDQGRAHVRDTDVTIEVVVVRRVGEQIRTLAGLGGLSDRSVPTDEPLDWRLARAVAACTLSLPVALSRGSTGTQTTQQLERNYFPSWQDQPWLQGSLPLVLDADGAAVVGDCAVTYSIESGLEHAHVDHTNPGR